MPRDDRQTDPASLKQLRYQIEELTHRNEELEKFNITLTTDRKDLKQNLADCSRLLETSTTGLISLDKTGLITNVSSHATHLLGADKEFLLKKPISLFIAPEDQATFYINRSKISAGNRMEPFEIKLKRKDGAIWSARVNAQTVDAPGQHLPGMLLAVEDITRYRQVLEALQLKEYFTNLLFSIIDDLSIWSTADIDEIIIYSLEKVGLLSSADRVYVCLFHDRKTKLSITHEWVNDGVESPASSLMNAPVENFSSVLAQVKKRCTITVGDMNTLQSVDYTGHGGFHSPGMQSFMFTSLFYGRYLLGIIGCDAVRQPVSWPQETQNLVKCIGGLIVNALIRRQAEKATAEVRETILQLVKPTTIGVSAEDGAVDLPEYEGPIEFIDDDLAVAAEKKTGWRFEEGGPEDPSLLITALLKDGKTANIACRDCNRQKLLELSDIRTLGTRLKATCACGNEMFIKIELRREHRKIVSLDGVFIRGQGDRIAMKSDDWGRIQVNNLSRHGIGFKVSGQQDVRIEDRFRVKFTLDNTAGSTIQKNVVVRSVNEDVVGCQFTDEDPCDVTIGFYMMT